MAQITAQHLPQLAISIRGLITIPADDTDPTPRRMIIQGATEENANARDINGKPIIIYQYRPPSVPMTYRQARQRALMAAAVIWYQSLTTPEKEAYRPAAQAARISIWNAALRDYMLKNPVQPPTIWDGGLSTWDNGMSPWDELAGMPWDDGSTEWDNGDSIWNR